MAYSALSFENTRLIPQRKTVHAGRFGKRLRSAKITPAMLKKDEGQTLFLIAVPIFAPLHPGQFGHAFGKLLFHLDAQVYETAGLTDQIALSGRQFVHDAVIGMMNRG